MSTLSNTMQGSKIDEIPEVDVGSTREESYIDDEEIELTNVITCAILNIVYHRPCMHGKSRVDRSNQSHSTTGDVPHTIAVYDLCSEHVAAKLLLRPKDDVTGDTFHDVH